MDDVFDWRVKLRDIGENGASGSRVASAEERQELARVMDIQSCNALQLEYKIQPLRSGLYRLTGRLVADVVQACVITLEPVHQQVDEALNVELRPADMLPEAPAADEDILSSPDLAVIENDEINLGLIVLEHISTVIDPYPRATGAELDVQDATAGTAANPFEVLNKLKNQG